MVGDQERAGLIYRKPDRPRAWWSPVQKAGHDVMKPCRSSYGVGRGTGVLPGHQPVKIWNAAARVQLIACYNSGRD